MSFNSLRKPAIFVHKKFIDMVIVQKPQGICFSGMLPKLVIKVSHPVSIELLVSNKKIIEESYISDEDDEIIVDLKGPVEETLNFTVPTTDLFQQLELMKTFSVKITEGELAPETITFTAIRGGVKTLSITTDLWLKANFLTWQPQQKQVEWIQPEWLTYYAENNCELKITAHYKESDVFPTKTIALSGGKVWSINMQFGRIAAMFDKQPLYFDAEIWAGGKKQTYTQRYIIKSNIENAKTFLFENSLGGMDSVIFDGSFTRTPEYEEEVGLLEDIESGYYISKKDNISQNTGYISRYSSEWLQEMFGSLKKYIVQDGALQQVIIDSIDSSVDSENDLIAFEFTYRPAQTTPYLALERNYENLPELLDITGPDEQLFFLAPRLIEFPEAKITDEMLFPVQSPFEQKWHRINYAKLKEDILKDVETAGISGITWSEITGKPTVFPPADHTHLYAGSTAAGGAANSALILQTARNITIGNTTKPFNGSANVAWSLAEIGVNLSGYVLTTDPRLSDARPASDVSAWAKQATKPAYAWNEVTGKPTVFPPADHTHLYAGSTTAGGAANSALILQTARNITIGNTTKSFNGSANVAWSLAEIGVNLSSYVLTTDPRLSDARPASDVSAWAKQSTKPTYTWNEVTGKPTVFPPADHTHLYAGSTAAGGAANSALLVGNKTNLQFSPIASTLTGANALGCKILLPTVLNKMVVFTVRAYRNYVPVDIQFSGYFNDGTSTVNPPNWYDGKAIMIAGDRSTNVKMGRNNDGRAYVWIAGPSNYAGVAVLDVVSGFIAQDWSSGWEIKFTDDTPNAVVDSTIYPPAGSTTAGGAANSALILQTARNITIGNTTKSFNGSANVAWSLAEIGITNSVVTSDWDELLNINKGGFYSAVIDNKSCVGFSAMNNNNAGIQIAGSVDDIVPRLFMRRNRGGGVHTTSGWAEIWNNSTLPVYYGEWVPSIRGSVNAGIANLTLTSCFYKVISNTVYLSAIMNGTWTSPPSGELIIAGVPFTAASTQYGIGSLMAGYMDTDIVPFIRNNTREILFRKRGGVASPIIAPVFGTHISNTQFAIYINIIYRAFE